MRTGHGGWLGQITHGVARRVMPPGRGIITEAVRKCAAEQGLADEEALKAGMAEKSREFTEAGGEVYQQA